MYKTTANSSYKQQKILKHERPPAWATWTFPKLSGEMNFSKNLFLFLREDNCWFSNSHQVYYYSQWRQTSLSALAQGEQGEGESSNNFQKRRGVTPHSTFLGAMGRDFIANDGLLALLHFKLSWKGFGLKVHYHFENLLTYLSLKRLKFFCLNHESKLPFSSPMVQAYLHRLREDTPVPNKRSALPSDWEISHREATAEQAVPSCPVIGTRDTVEQDLGRWEGHRVGITCMETASINNSSQPFGSSNFSKGHVALAPWSALGAHAHEVR